MMSERESHLRNASLTPQSLGTSDESYAPLGNVTKPLLRHLSNASNETAVATSIGLAILIYFVFGRLGLLLIGVVVGVVLHASWEVKESSSSARLRLQRRKQLKRTGLEVVDTLLHWRTEVNESSKEEAQTGHGNRETAHDIDSLKSLPKTADAVEQLKDAILQNYVTWGNLNLWIECSTNNLQFLVLASLPWRAQFSPRLP